MRAARPAVAGRLYAVAAAVVATVCLILAVAGAASASSPSPAAPSISASPGVTIFRLGTMEDVDNLNPFIGYSGVDYLVYHLNYDFLVGFDPAKLQPRPEFAESWSHSPDGKTWTFKIRPGMTWQDGQPATAHDVAFTFNYIIKNNLTNFTSYTTLIKDVVAPNDTTVIFHCTKPKADILDMKVPILPEHIWSKVSGQAARTSFTNAAPCIGSGPYEVAAHKPGSYAELVANKDYWRGKPHIDELFIETYTDADTMAEDLKSGALDGAIGVLPAQFKSLSATPGITADAATSWSFEQLTFNCYDNPNSTGNRVLLGPKFRQALQYAVDRQKNAAVAYDGYFSPGSTLLPPYSAYYWQPPSGRAYTYDPAKANQMLSAAGYKMGSNGYRTNKQGKPFTLRLYTDAQTPENIITSKLVVGWFQKVGVNVRLSVLDPGALDTAEANYKGKTFAPDFDTLVWWWEGDADPQYIMSLLTPSQVGGWSDTSWTDPQYTKLFNEESTAVDQQTRIALVNQMQQIEYQASPYLIFGYMQFLIAYNTAKWDGYVREPNAYPGYTGDVFYYDTFLDLHSSTGAASGGGNTRTWVVLAVVVALVVVVVIVVLRRRHHGPETEPES